jgi:AmmeMemoRadiSam system protein B
LEGITLVKNRKPVVAGQFYEAGKNALEDRIKECFLDERGPQTLPEIRQGEKNILGLVVPHAGYIYSGAIAAHSYNFLANNGFADNFIILGPNHTGMGSGISLMTDGCWETPLGQIPINQNMAKQLTKGIIDADETAHTYEHSIEVQLPFLQYMAQNKKISFVPICMGLQDYKTSKEIGEIIAETIKNIKEKTVIIASTDFSHAGFNYSSMPPEGIRVDDYAKEQDKLAINKILDMNPEGLINTVHENNITMCGYGPVSAMLVACSLLGATHAELLKYGTSYEVYPSSSCVGYGALSVY